MTYKMFVPDSYNWIVGPTYKLGEKEFSVVWKDFEKLGILKYCKRSYSKKQGDMAITTPWGAVLEVASAEKQDSLLGEGLFHVIMARLQNTVALPGNSISSLRYLTIGVAPTFQVHHRDLIGIMDCISWARIRVCPIICRGSTVAGRISFDIQVVEKIQKLNVLKASRKHWFDQEYGASFTAIAGSIYDELTRISTFRRRSTNPSLPNYMAFDYGYVNPFVALDIQITADEMYRLA